MSSMNGKTMRALCELSGRLSLHLQIKDESYVTTVICDEIMLVVVRLRYIATSASRRLAIRCRTDAPGVAFFGGPVELTPVFVAAHAWQQQ